MSTLFPVRAYSNTNPSDLAACVCVCSQKTLNVTDNKDEKIPTRDVCLITLDFLMCLMVPVVL
jgi:hypothetical protein